MYDKYKDQGLIVLGVHAWSGRESKEDARKFVKDREVTYPILLGGHEVHRKLYKCKYVPRVFFIDRRGRIAATTVGFGEGEEKRLARTVKDLL